MKKQTIRGVCIVIIAVSLVILLFASLPSQNQILQQGFSNSTTSILTRNSNCLYISPNDTNWQVFGCGTLTAHTTITTTVNPPQGLPLWTVGIVVLIMVVLTIILYLKASRVKLPVPLSPDDVAQKILEQATGMKAKCTCQIWDESKGNEPQIPLSNHECKCVVHGCDYQDPDQAACCGHNCGLD